MAGRPGELIWEMICNSFPDGVDLVRVDKTQVVEYISPQLIEPQLDEPIEPRQTELILKELEPETGIYGAMSLLTHRIYIFVDPWVQIP